MVDRQRVLIVDDHPVVRRGLRAMLEGEPWVDEVLDAATVEEAVRVAVQSRPDVVAMDVILPDGDGVEATRQIVQRCPGTNVLMMTFQGDEHWVARALRAGARGYVLKDTEPDTVIDALRTVAGGGLALGPRLGPGVLTALERAPSPLPPPFDGLTSRERAILAGLVRGEGNAAIARRLGLSEKTVRNYLSVVFEKLSVSSRVQAALRAREAGIEG
jgi:two-component system nitrate/nitrite response regulator NarL